MPLLLLMHLAATLAMFGVIWFVQIVHYPLMAKVGRDGFPAYEQTHMRLTTLVVAPLMLTEAGTGFLLIARAAEYDATGWWLGLALLGAIWLITFTMQVPAHRKLSLSFDPAAHARLVQSNWLRTIGWTLRAALVLWLVAPQLRAG